MSTFLWVWPKSHWHSLKDHVPADDAINRSYSPRLRTHKNIPAAWNWCAATLEQRQMKHSNDPNLKGAPCFVQLYNVPRKSCSAFIILQNRDENQSGGNAALFQHLSVFPHLSGTDEEITASGKGHKFISVRPHSAHSCAAFSGRIVACFWPGRLPSSFLFFLFQKKLSSLFAVMATSERLTKIDLFKPTDKLAFTRLFDN